LHDLDLNADVAQLRLDEFGHRAVIFGARKATIIVRFNGRPSFSRTAVAPGAQPARPRSSAARARVGCDRLDVGGGRTEDGGRIIVVLGVGITLPDAGDNALLVNGAARASRTAGSAPRS
jgi:hypothetical protein